MRVLAAALLAFAMRRSVEVVVDDEGMRRRSAQADRYQHIE